MTIYDLKYLVNFAKKNSPYYRDLYKDIDLVEHIAQLPIVDQKHFWAQNTLKNNKLLTFEARDGIVFKSGGTTGNPKFSMFTDDEWQTFTTSFGWGMAHGGIASGNRIANIFYVGDLYASFLFIMKSIENAPVKSLHFPIAGSTAIDQIVEKIEEFDLDIITAAPTTLMHLSEYLHKQSKKLLSVQKILFGGEAIYPDQIELITQVFPNALVRSIGYASVDAGLLGYADESCDIQEHRPFAIETIIEIIDSDTNEVILKPGVQGKIVVTSLTRLLMPIIRYPSGDMGYWVDQVNGKFKIAGRSDEGARVGPITIYLDDLRQIVMAQDRSHVIANLQTCIKHFEGKDQLVLRLVPSHDSFDKRNLSDEIVKDFYASRKMYEQHMLEGKVHPCKIDWISHQELKTNLRTGKLIQLIDERQ